MSRQALSFTLHKLREIYSSPVPETLVIIVPGIDTGCPDTWFEGQAANWKTCLPNDVLPSPAVYEFDYKSDSYASLRLSNPLIWKDILHQGLDLLDALLELFNSRIELRECSIVFIAHSLGGMVVKHCLTKALENTADFKSIARAVVALIALATPHSKSKDPKDWDQPQLISGAKNNRKRGSYNFSDDAKRLAEVCRRFEEVATNLPILTVCEQKETTVKGWMFIRVNKVMIVNRDSIKIQSRLEQVIEVNANHFDICNVVTREQISSFLQLRVLPFLLQVNKELRGDPAPQPVLNEASVADHDVDQLTHPRLQPSRDEDSERWQNSSNQATIAKSDSKLQGLTNLSDFTTAKRDPSLPCHIIPGSKNHEFYGRDDVLAKIEESLAPEEESAESNYRELKTFGLVGPGGIGKTQVATEYCLSHKDMYEAIFWVHAEALPTLSDEFSKIAELLGLVLAGTADARDPIVTRELVKGWLVSPVRSYNRSDNKAPAKDIVPWLLVFDNADDIAMLSDFWPPEGSIGAVLVTSRDHLAKAPFYRIHDGLDVPPLSTANAAELLLHLTWRVGDEQEEKYSRAVAEKLDGLPLALTQMAGVMVRQNLSFADFLRRYDEEETHYDLFKLSMEPSHRRTSYAHTLATVWAIESLEHSSGLIDVLAYLDPDGISQKLLQDAMSQVSLKEYPRTISAYQEARSELLRSSLILSDRNASKITVHRLIQDVVRTKMSVRRATDVFGAAVDTLTFQWPAAEPGVRHHVGRWAECEALSPHILRLRDHFMRAQKDLKQILTSSLSFALLLNELGWYFQERGYTDDAVECYKIAQANTEFILDSALPDDDETTDTKGQDRPARLQKAIALLAETHNNLAGAATEYNDAPTALHHFQLYHDMLTEEHEGLTTIADSRLTSAAFNLGMSHAMMGKYNEAVALFEEAVTEANRLSDIKNIKTARSLALVNMGLTLWCMGQHDEAYETLSRALREREELLGYNDRQSMITGRVLHCLGNVEFSLGHMDDSLEFHERALLHFKETVGNNHHRTGNSCFKVAEHYSRKGRHQEAIELLDQALKIFDRNTCYTPEKGRATLMQSVILAQQGQSAESDICLQKAISLHRSIEQSSESGKEISLDDFSRFVHIWGR